MTDKFQLTAVRYGGNATSPFDAEGKPVGVNRVGVFCRTCFNRWTAHSGLDLENRPDGVRLQCSHCDAEETVPYNDVEPVPA